MACLLCRWFFTEKVSIMKIKLRATIKIMFGAVKFQCRKAQKVWFLKNKFPVVGFGFFFFFLAEEGIFRETQVLQHAYKRALMGFWTMMDLN